MNSSTIKGVTLRGRSYTFTSDGKWVFCENPENVEAKKSATFVISEAEPEPPKNYLYLEIDCSALSVESMTWTWQVLPLATVTMKYHADH